ENDGVEASIRKRQACAVEGLRRNGQGGEKAVFDVDRGHLDGEQLLDGFRHHASSAADIENAPMTFVPQLAETAQEHRLINRSDPLVERHMSRQDTGYVLDRKLANHAAAYAAPSGGRASRTMAPRL